MCDSAGERRESVHCGVTQMVTELEIGSARSYSAATRTALDQPRAFLELPVHSVYMLYEARLVSSCTSPVASSPRAQLRYTIS